MARMSDEELMRYRNAAEANSIHASDEMNADNQRFFEFYSGCPLGNEVSGESQVISTDVYDVVESVMPSLVRVFLGSNDVMKFSAGAVPLLDVPADQNLAAQIQQINNQLIEREKQSAEDKTKYINWLIREQPGSYKNLLDWMKGGVIYRYSAISYGAREENVVKTVQYSGVSEIELSQIEVELQQQAGKGAEIEFEEVEREEEDGLFDVEATIKKTALKYFVEYIDPERFVITRGATSVDDAETVGHDEYLTKSSLIEMGYKKKVVQDLPHVSMSADPRRHARLQDQGGTERSNNIHWTGEIVKLETRYLKVDRDGDGISERRKIVSVGTGNGIITNTNQNISSGSGVILEDEPYEIAPYGLLTSIPLPGQAIGKSLAEVTMETQLIKSTLLRQTMMNMYNVNSARMAINSRVNKDDLLTNRLGGIVRVKGDDNPAANISPLPVPFIGDKALLVMQYADAARAQRTGTIPGSQSLEADQVNTETATRFEGVQDVAAAKVELIARSFAETGFRELFTGMLWTVAHFQKEATEIMVLGKPLTIDPRRWLTDQPIVSNVGLGAGDDETILTNMGSLLQIHQQLGQLGSPLTDSKKVYNVLDKITKAMNQKNPSEYFNNPDVPQELLMAQVEQLSAQNQQLQQMVNNPLAEAEQIKAQSDLLQAQAKQQLDAAKLVQDQQKFQAEMSEEQRQFNDSMAAKLTEMELKYSGKQPNNPNVPGSLV